MQAHINTCDMFLNNNYNFTWKFIITPSEFLYLKVMNI